MIHTLRLSLLLPLLCAPLALAEDADAPPPPVMVKKDFWVKGMKDQLPAAFCRESMYFRQCFAISETECLNSAKKATEACLAEHDGELPQLFAQPRDGTTFGAKIGTCAGIAFEKANKSKQSKEAKCQDASAWVP